jgi:hypothetical protein
VEFTILKLNNLFCGTIEEFILDGALCSEKREKC